MPVTLRLAFRNLAQHAAKSLIVGSLLALGVFILILGNSFLDASARGIERSFTANYTGDVIITGVANGDVSLFGVMSVGGMEETPVVPDYEKVFAHAAGLPGVKAVTGTASGFGLITRGADQAIEDTLEDAEDEEEQMDSFVMLFGVDAANYWSLFDGIELVQGSFLEPGKPGIMVGDERLARIGKRLGRDLAIGDEILIQGMGPTGMRLRSVPIVGTYRAPSDSAGPEQLSYIDIDTLRVLAGMTVGANEDIELSETETGMLDLDNLDDMFGDEFMVDAAAPGAVASLDSLGDILGDTTERERLNQADSGAWHSILLRLDRPETARLTAARLNLWFQEEGIQAVAGDWQKAAGPYAQSVDVLRLVFTIAVTILAIVAVIVITNTLVVSVNERTGEIGTMRALGAGKGFVRRMFAAETVVLSVVFGLLGMVLALGTVGALNLIGIQASNQFLEILFGGPVLKPVATLGSIIGSLVLIVAVGLLAHLYPVAVALRIQPVRAMQSE